MRTMTAVFLTLTLFAASGFAQTTPATQTIYQESTSILDQAGNLLVVDAGAAYTASTTNPGRDPYRRGTPKARLTLIHPGGATQTVEYDGSVELVGASDLAIYAVVTMPTSAAPRTYTQTLIAIVGNSPLSTSLAGFPGLALTVPATVRLGPADTLSLMTAGARATSTTAATPRTVKVVRFNGLSFGNPISTATLP